jgi:hypothetical protein
MFDSIRIGATVCNVTTGFVYGVVIAIGADYIRVADDVRTAKNARNFYYLGNLAIN